jgi:ketosteroid isomerase-like protein
VEADQIYADEDGHVFALGHYPMTTKDGNTVLHRFIHLWTVGDGKLKQAQIRGFLHHDSTLPCTS